MQEFQGLHKCPNAAILCPVWYISSTNRYISGHSDELERSIKNKCVPGQDISLIYRIYIRCLQGNSERRSFTATGLRGTGTRTLPPCLKNNQNQNKPQFRNCCGTLYCVNCKTVHLVDKVIHILKKVIYGGMGIIATIFYVFGQPLEC